MGCRRAQGRSRTVPTRETQIGCVPSNPVFLNTLIPAGRRAVAIVVCSCAPMRAAFGFWLEQNNFGKYVEWHVKAGTPGTNRLERCMVAISTGRPLSAYRERRTSNAREAKLPVLLSTAFNVVRSAKAMYTH